MTRPLRSRESRAATSALRGTSGPEVVVVIAAYNESGPIAEVVRGLRAHGHDVVVVDDASHDTTAQEAASAGATVLRHAVNLGQGAALRTGFAYVAATRHDAIVVTFDADGQHSPDDVAALVAPVQASSADVVLGSRFLRQASIERVPASRRLLLRAAVWMARRTTGLALSDAHNGLRALRLAAIRRMELRQDRMAHASELLAEIARLKLRTLEVPVTVAYTEYSRAKGQRTIDSINILWDLTISRLR